MLASGQLLGDEGREPIPPAIPEGGIQEVKYAGRRTNVVRLLPSGAQERKLRRLASTSAKLFNEVNYERRQQFFRGEKVDLGGRGISTTRGTRVRSASTPRRSCRRTTRHGARSSHY
ncbi:MAG: hypothetical protein RXR82_09260 [Nitrososphaeria archaeon]